MNSFVFFPSSSFEITRIEFFTLWICQSKLANYIQRMTAIDWNIIKYMDKLNTEHAGIQTDMLVQPRPQQCDYMKLFASVDGTLRCWRDIHPSPWSLCFTRVIQPPVSPATLTHWKVRPTKNKHHVCRKRCKVKILSQQCSSVVRESGRTQYPDIPVGIRSAEMRL